MTAFDSFLDPAKSESVGAIAVAFAGIERDLHEAVQTHYEALGIDPPEDGPRIETRVEELRTLVGHHIEGDLWGYFLEEQAPDGLRNPDRARSFAGLDDETWADRLETLADAAPGNDGTIRERAGVVVESRFGLDLETFERRIVGWRPERTLKRALRGPIDADIERIRLATAALERSGE